MNTIISKDIQRLLSINNGVIASSQAKSVSRRAYAELLFLAQTGYLFKLRNGKYIENSRLAATMIDLERIIPGGVLCLYSAWAYYNLTTQIPTTYTVAIPKNHKITLPDYPPISLYRWDGATLETGVTKAVIEGCKIKIYDLEKSICDAVKFRNKIGIDVMSEIVRTYLKREDRNIPKLTKYAKQLRVYNTLEKYLEIEL